ncbi:proteasome-activating nucleotidase [Methanomicrobium antiquum]|uniref:Proteasome-activating nucleotidase n=1 Tax=Methanomicrobium antiquum TaxID=487686 RepID=A0AAF0FQ99_9EURY|nr:proteasome-activating nucleotidase [Methanomicrobium antiquum]MDD3976712.1 proteasome-activating nucleotidase [Methanomicrobium sp.]WFN35946.1 proteasome-activating nucleotidase [Methanomicrobium antiquum]
MDETIYNTPEDSDMSKLRLQELYDQVEELSMKVEFLNRENGRLEKEVAQLKKENNQLKRPPLFVAAVIDVMDSGEVYLRQQGNNQEYITHYIDTLEGKLKPGMKVAVNNALSIVRTVDNTFDSRVRVMELEESPNVTFAQIGGLKEEIEEVREAVEYPLTRPEIFEKVGVEPPKGILLYGPPGTGKTLIAKAVANQAKATFIRMSGSELVHKFIGEGAQMVRELFSLAREKSPSIVFIDEIDSIGSMRTQDGTSGSAEVQRTLMQLLAEMDGFDNRGNVRLMAATNRVDMLDPALLRPGRFDRILEVSLPDEKSRLEILKIHSAKLNMKDVEINSLLKITENATGAEIQAICREAGMNAVRNNSDYVTMKNFTDAVFKVRRKTRSEDIMYI